MSSIADQERRNSLLMEEAFSPRKQALEEIALFGKAERSGSIAMEVRNVWNRVMNWRGDLSVGGLTMEQIRECRSVMILQYVDGVIEELMRTEEITAQVYRYALTKKQEFEFSLDERRPIQDLLAVLDPSGKAKKDWLAFWARRAQQKVEEKYEEIERESRKELRSQSAEFQHYGRLPQETQGCCSIS